MAIQPSTSGPNLTRRTALVGAGALALAAATHWPVPRATAADPLAVPNAGFEEPMVGTTIPGWTPRYAGTDAQVVTSPVRSGAHALTITDTSTTAAAGVISDPIAVRGGTTYEIGAWAWSREGLPSFLAYFHDAAGVQVGATLTHIIRTPTNSWNWEGEVATAPQNAATVRILLYSANGGTSRTTWDDVTVREVATWTEESLGHPVTAPNVLDTSYGIGPDGGAEIYSVTATVPGVFQVIDAGTGREKARATLPDGAYGSWTVLTARDGRVYIGVYNNGHVYRWDPVAGVLSDLGRATPKCLYVWDLEEAPDGRIWGGTYPAGEVFCFDPVTDTFTGLGSLGAEEYVRSIAVGPHGTVYAGTGSTRPSIFALDPNTGARTEILLPEKYRDQEFVYHLDTAENLVFARLSPSSTMIVLDTTTGRWADDLGPVAFTGISPVDARGLVYVVDSSGTLFSYNIRTRQRTDTMATGLEPPRGFGWLPGAGRAAQVLAFMYQGGDIVHYHTRTGQVRRFASEVVEAPIKIQSQQALPDGRVVVGGYMYEGVSVLDPATGTWTESPRGDVGQVEGMWVHGQDLYLGTYTRANLYRWNYDSAWQSGSNPHHLGSLFDHHQDRPFAWASVGDLVVTGTVPGYGQVGGVLAVIDAVTGQVAVHDDVVPGHSIVALAARGTVVYGTTSIHGGLGATPTAAAAVVFAWDVVTRSKLWEATLSAEVRAIEAIKVGPDGRLWAVDVGTLYELNPVDGAILRSAQLMPFFWGSNTGPIWVGADIEFTAGGVMVVLARGTLFEVDPGSLRHTRRAAGISNYVITVHGEQVYLARGDEMFRLRTSG